MVRLAVRAMLALACVAVVELNPASAQETRVLTTRFAPPRPDQDDSTLRAVAFSGARQAWAAGDRGVLWRTENGGASWQLLALTPAMEHVSWTRIRFLTDRVGWVCGTAAGPAGSAPQGVLLRTVDGGTTWTAPEQDLLPPLHDVHFFDLEQGVAIGIPTSRFGTGVLRTRDGGKTWTALASSESRAWQAATFFSPEEGIAVGSEGRNVTIARETLLEGGRGLSGLRGLHAVKCDLQGRGWLAGDGGLLLRTDNRGISWKLPQDSLPEKLTDFMDFRALAVRGERVWATGNPGGVVWHTADGGARWIAQSTGGSTPILAMEFQDDQFGIAVGALGRICLTHDGGATWANARGAGRRLACLSIGVSPDQIPLSFLTRWSREDGYRTAHMLAVRRDLGPDAARAREADWRMSLAVSAAGGSHADTDWRLPVAIPSLEQDREKLMAEWSRLTDRRMVDVMLSRFVAELRTWQPEAVLLAEPEENDFAALTVQQALLTAVRLASDPGAFPEHQTWGKLPPAKVRKVILQRQAGAKGSASQDPLEILPHLRTTLDAALAEPVRRLNTADSAGVLRTEFVIAWRADESLSERVLLHDLNLPVGSAARRDLEKIEMFDYERLATQVRHRQQVNAIARSFTSQPGRGDQLMAQIADIVRPLTPQQAAQQLAELGRMHQATGNWVAAEETWLELARRYPQEPAAAEGLVWLATYWSSAELNWQRLRTYNFSQTVTRGLQASDAQSALGELERAVQAVLEAQQVAGGPVIGESLEPPIQQIHREGAPQDGNLQSVVTANGQGTSQHQQLLTRWQSQAVAVLAGIRKSHPQLREDPQLQFVTASLARRRSQPKQADEIYQAYFQRVGSDPWQIASRGEIYLLRPGAQSPKPMVQCRKVTAPPLLDGVLSDACWTEAAEIRLAESPLAESYVGARASDAGPEGQAAIRPIVMLARDESYLYMAASVPIDGRLPVDGPQLPGRTHDATLDRFDRLAFQFDVDRDYATYYAFEIDQRGMTRDSLWNNVTYNPRWHCAAVRDADSWRVECAIPLEELAPAESLLQDVWGVGITRIRPGVGVESWTGSGGNVPQPPLFGLVRF